MIATLNNSTRGRTSPVDGQMPWNQTYSYDFPCYKLRSRTDGNQQRVIVHILQNKYRKRSSFFTHAWKINVLKNPYDTCFV